MVVSACSIPSGRPGARGWKPFVRGR